MISDVPNIEARRSSSVQPTQESYCEIAKAPFDVDTVFVQAILAQFGLHAVR